jgi:DNA-binding transcriptional MocR family regulator
VITRFVAGSIRERVSDPVLGTETGPSSPIAGFSGLVPTRTVATTLSRLGSTRETVFEAARARQVGLYALGEHRIRTRGGPALLLGYAATTEPGLRAGVREHAAAVRAVSA